MRHRGFPHQQGYLRSRSAMVALASMPVAAQAPKAGARPAPTTPRGQTLDAAQNSMGRSGPAGHLYQR